MDSVSITFTCDQNVERGSQGGCYLQTYPSSHVLSNIEWGFVSFEKSNLESGGLNWTGTLVTGGMVHVTAFSNYIGVWGANDSITVKARNLSWASLVDNREASGSEVDACLAPGDAGRAVGSECDSPANADAILVPEDPADGYDIGVGTGPNQGIHYIENPTIALSMRSVVARRYRSDGSQHPIQGSTNFMNLCGDSLSGDPMNNHQVNGGCPGTDFTQFVTHVWDHENQHLTVAEAEAVKDSVDLHALWEDIVNPDPGTVVVSALTRWSASYDSIYTASAALDAGPPTNSFQFWRYVTGSGFVDFNILVH